MFLRECCATDDAMLFLIQGNQCARRYGRSFALMSIVLKIASVRAINGTVVYALEQHTAVLADSGLIELRPLMLPSHA